ncbi:MAG: hypothetical protein QOG00_255 [Pyrinomonadaceae bacterium]|nr:hypothetical protein [Pyrinomonadaceae bacterium]
MSPEVTSQPSARRLLEHPIIVGLLFSVVLPALMAAGSVWYAQGQTARDIDAIQTKQAATDERVDADKRERVEEFKELREKVVTKEVLDEKWETVKKIDRTVDRLLELQLRERR